MKSINGERRNKVKGAERHPLVSVVIVNFNGGWLLTEAVRSVLEADISLEIIVVDNGSRDSSLTCLRSIVDGDSRVRMIENNRNLGFARANNIALRQVLGEYVLLLNPDCVIRPNTLPSMLEAMVREPEAGMAGCLLRNPDGTEQAGCRRSVPTPWRTFVRVLHLNKLFPYHPRFQGFVLSRQVLPRESFSLEAISGAFMLVRREGLKHVGLLDENYFLHCEDLDWCMRFRQAGWKILFVPSVEVVHYKGTCSKDWPIRVLWYKHKGMVYFYRKFFRHQYPLSLMGLVTGAVWGRFCVLAGLTLLRRLVAEGRAKAGFRMRNTFYLAGSSPKVASTSATAYRAKPESTSVSGGVAKRAHSR
ncbi:glycosyltransferase family 2 protein [Nitrosococcus oceani]|uniref:Glycosyl transferase, family 2 n=2 Tax=Nitrosococcus oceani TaxID=1229 RepID=Q3J968_NITOC|nr:glycosyltransferase family 2 protein [Nitrosococcus oceani]KFI18929.1 glycosyl transferase family 2 [Nitrosococcus oceani C-27]ABA58628.1 Glycosyl transferase, family 2 [Nitrosococcus oceani ATCC 19707]EDZ66875.1 glycosyl transferase, group 2 family protein [Nitrosococcus oceani AFC27]KFI22211.1 glycosyl transferase family 2 [Nitrosococcus oceani]GEM19748.1 glycosyl transferase [Nitrosococcus oceani]